MKPVQFFHAANTSVTCGVNVYPESVYEPDGIPDHFLRVRPAPIIHD